MAGCQEPRPPDRLTDRTLAASEAPSKDTCYSDAPRCSATRLTRGNALLPLECTEGCAHHAGGADRPQAVCTPGPQPPHSARSPEHRPCSSPATHHASGVPAEALYGHPSPWDARSPSLGLTAIPSHLPPHQPRHCRQRPNSTSQDLRAQDAVWGREEFLIFHRHISQWIQSDLQPANSEMEENVSVEHLQPARISPPLHLVLMFSNQLFQMQEI